MKPVLSSRTCFQMSLVVHACAYGFSNIGAINTRVCSLPTTTTTTTTAIGTTTITSTISRHLILSNIQLVDKKSRVECRARRRRDFDDDSYDDDDDDRRYYDDEYDVPRKRRGRGDPYGRDSPIDSLDVPSSFSETKGWRLPQSLSQAILAGVFVLGIGLGVTIDSAINTNPRDLASRDAIDQAAPNSGLCANYGASAMAFDQRVFVSFNPFNVYVAQADVKPACVLRPSNVVPILKERNLINDAEVRSCKSNMNTWAFVGSLEDAPQLSCVYKSEDAQNEFLSNPKYGIGEDYLDDDRDRVDSFKKNVKIDKTQGQKDALRRQVTGISD